MSAVNLYVGDVAHLTCAVLDVDGNAATPGTISVSVKPPAGTLTLYTPVQDATGVYHYDYPLTLAGQFYVRWQTTGANQAVKESGFIVSALRA